MDHKPTFTDYLSILYKWKKFLIINLLIISIITTGITFLIPERFKAKAVVMMTDDGSSMGGLGSMLSNVGSILGGAFTGSSSSPIDKIFGYLESRSIMQKVINKFDLVNYYEITNYKRDKALKALRENTSFDLTDNGLVEVSMIHKNPEIAANIVNYFIEQADSLNRHYSNAYAKQYREFVEQRYFKNLEDISKAEEVFETFQKKYKIYALPEQLEIAFQAIAKLEAELTIKEIEREVVSVTQGVNNPSYKIAANNVELFKKKLNELESGQFSTDESVIYFPLKKIPALQKEYTKIYRELEVQAKLLEYTLPMYEQALMEERKNIPTMMVVDSGIPPQLKDSPKKGFIILSVFFLFLFFNIFIVYRGEDSLSQQDKMNIIKTKERNFFLSLVRFYRMKLM